MERLYFSPENKLAMNDGMVHLASLGMKISKRRFKRVLQLMLDTGLVNLNPLEQTLTSSRVDNEVIQIMAMRERRRKQPQPYSNP